MRRRLGDADKVGHGVLLFLKVLEDLGSDGVAGCCERNSIDLVGLRALLEAKTISCRGELPDGDLDFAELLWQLCRYGFSISFQVELLNQSRDVF